MEKRSLRWKIRDTQTLLIQDRRFCIFADELKGSSSRFTSSPSDANASNICGTGLRDHHVLALISDESINALAIKERAKYLNFSNNQITSLGAQYISYRMPGPGLSRLQMLDLSNNFCGDQGCIYLADMIGDALELQLLNLSCNQIGPVGAGALARALTFPPMQSAWKPTSKLETLILSFNAIGDSGALALATMLEDNSVLLHLDLAHNRLTVHGALHLAAALRSNCTLRALAIAPVALMDLLVASNLIRKSTIRTRSRPAPLQASALKSGGQGNDRASAAPTDPEGRAAAAGWWGLLRARRPAGPTFAAACVPNQCFD